MTPTERDRLTALCRQGDPKATIEILRHAYRKRDYRLFEIGLAGGFLCEEVGLPGSSGLQTPESQAKRCSHMLLATMAGPTDMWESPIWKMLQYLE